MRHAVTTTMLTRTRAMCALFFTFATSSAALAQEAPDEAPPSSEATPSAPAAESARVPRERTYAIGGGLTGSRFRTESGQAMGMAGAAAVFDYTVGRRFAFGIHGGMSFPMHGRLRDDGTAEAFNIGAMYGKKLSLDAMFLFLHRWRVNDSIDLVVGYGLHVHTLRLVARVYNPIELISAGAGGLARVERRFGSRFFFAGEVTAAIDPLDFVHHKNRALYVAPITLAFTIGVRR